MKRSIIITSLVLLVSAVMSAQDTNQDQLQNRNQSGNRNQTKVREHVNQRDGTGTQTMNQISSEEKRMLKVQRKAQKRVKKANHGQVVSETARSTGSGPGKGEVVRTQARTKEPGAAKGLRPAAKGPMGNAGQKSPRLTGAGRK